GSSTPGGMMGGSDATATGVTIAELWLLARFVSGVTVLTVAVFWTLTPPAAERGTRAVTVIVPTWPTSNVGLVQLMLLLIAVQVKSADDTDCSTRGLGVG